MSLIRFVLLTFALMSVVDSAAAQRPVTVSSLFGDDKPETRIWMKIREIVDAKAPGQFAIRIVGNAALGGEKEVNEGVRLGSVQGALSTLAALSSWVPEGQTMDLPFIFRDRAHIARTLSGPIGDDLRKLYEAQGFQVLGFIVYGPRHLLAKEPITAPEQMRSKRIRVIQSPLHAELWRAFGANPTPIPIPETYNALKTGVVDMMDLTIPAYVGFKLNEVAPVVIETGHIWSVGAVFVSRAFWRGLNAEQQAVFAEAGREGARHFDDLMIADEAASLKQALAAGVRVVPVADRSVWEAQAAPARDAFAVRIGVADKARAILATQ